MPDSQWYPETVIWLINNVENYVVFPAWKVFNSDSFAVVSETKCATHFCREDKNRNKQKLGSIVDNRSKKILLMVPLWIDTTISKKGDYLENNVSMFAH